MSDQEEPDQAANNPSPQGRGYGLLIAAVAAVLLVLIVRFAIPVLLNPGAREMTRHGSCISNLVQLERATLMYAQDNDGVLPPARGWCDLTCPHVNDKQVYVCPEAFRAVGGYAMNDALSGRDLSAVPAPEATACLFDSATGWNMHGGPSLVANRHFDGATFGFADGHVKWVGPGSPSSYTWSVSAPPAGSGASDGP